MILDQKLASGDVIVLDGAIGSEIERLGGKMDDAAWCGVANRTHPETVRRVHEAYLEAGADVITANTFATCRHVLEAAGYGDETVAINQRAVELAREARDRVAPDRPVAIAGSMSNNVAWLPGTVGANPAYLPSPKHEAAKYREMVDVLADAGCDLLVMEMMLDVEHGSRLMEAALATGLPVWTGISTSQCPDGGMVGWDQAREEEDSRLPDGYKQPSTEPLETIIDALCALGPQVVGIMHSSFTSTTRGLEVLLKRWNGPFMAYPEATGFDAMSRQWQGPGQTGGLRCPLLRLGREWGSDHRGLLRYHHPPHPGDGGPAAGPTWTSRWREGLTRLGRTRWWAAAMAGAAARMDVQRVLRFELANPRQGTNPRMHAHQIQFLELLNGQVQYVVPQWQRRYRWGQREIERLIDDLVTVSEAGTDAGTMAARCIRFRNPDLLGL